MPIFHILFIISLFQLLSSLDDSKQCTAGYFQRNIAFCEKCEEFCNTINTLSIENQETCKPYCLKTSSVTTIKNSPTTAPRDKSNLIYICFIIPIIVVIAVIAVIIVCIRSGRFKRRNLLAVPVEGPLIQQQNPGPVKLQRLPRPNQGPVTLPLLPRPNQESNENCHYGDPYSSIPQQEDSNGSHHSGDDPYPSIHQIKDPSGDCSPSGNPFISIHDPSVTPTEEAGNLISGAPFNPKSDHILNSLITEAAANETREALLLPSIIGPPPGEDVEPPGGAGGGGGEADQTSVGDGAAVKRTDTLLLPSIIEPPGGAGGAGEDFVIVDKVGDDDSVGQGTVVLPSQCFTADAQNTPEGANMTWSADSEALLKESIWQANRKIAKNQGYSSTDKT